MPEAHAATRDHWERWYSSRPADRMGFYEPDPETSRHLVEGALAAGARSVIDIGGGASFVVDALLELGVERIAVLDVSPVSLAMARARLGERAERVEWMIGDVTELGDVGRFDIWHDRAVFHFLLDPADRRRYADLADRTVPVDGVAIMATFATDGPDHCSGLPVHRWDPDGLAVECGPRWRLSGSERHTHITPLGVDQSFVYATLRRVLDPGATP